MHSKERIYQPSPMDDQGRRTMEDVITLEDQSRANYATFRSKGTVNEVNQSTKEFFKNLSIQGVKKDTGKVNYLEISPTHLSTTLT